MTMNTDMKREPDGESICRFYLTRLAPILMLTLDTGGRIIDVNDYAGEIISRDPFPRNIDELIVSFDKRFDLQAALNHPDGKQMFSINTASGEPQTYWFTFRASADRILVFGHADIGDMERLQKETLSLNQETANLNRQLQKKNAQLQDALDHVKTLQGIIPICAHCHKIRNDEQIWDRLEKYLCEHTDAVLSHGICPDCLEKYYPDLKQDGK